MAARRPPYLLRLKVSNFRSLRDVDVRLRPLNVLVGPNGAGKSNLLDVIAFLGDAVRSDLRPALELRGGFGRVLFRGEDSQDITLEIDASVTASSSPSAPDRYSVRFSQDRIAFNKGKPSLRREEDFEFGQADVGFVVSGRDVVLRTKVREHITSLREDSLGLSSLPRLGLRQGGAEVDDLANLFAGFRVFDIDVAAARRPSAEGYNSTLAEDASNLAAFLAYMQEEHPDQFQALADDARTFIPGLDDIRLSAIGGAGVGRVLSLVERNLAGVTLLQEASYGSVRALALLALLYDPAPPRLTCIEEIDHGLHPHILDRLVDLLREASERTQFLIATHSPALVNRLTANELIVCERGEDSASRIPAIDPQVVRDMERELAGEVGLGELWFTGALGGVP